MSKIKSRKSLRILIVAFVIAIVCLLVLSYLPVFAAPSVRYWVGDGGTTNATTHWDYDSGGAGGDPIPDAETTIYFDAASFTGGGQVVTVDAALVCASMIWTNGADAPDLHMDATITSGGAVTLIAGITLSGASAIIITGTGNFDGAGLTIPALQLNGSAHTVSGANTFTTLTRTGTAADTTLTLAANQIISGTLTLAGNSIHNRLTVQSSVHTTQRTLTVAVVTPTNVDFYDIIAAGASHPWDVSAITGGSVDLGNNTDITFSYERYWVGNDGSWTDPLNHWAFTSGGTPDPAFMPNAIFDVNFDVNSFTAIGQSVDIDTSDSFHDMDWTGALNSPDFNIFNNGYPRCYGSLTFIANMSVHGMSNWKNRIDFYSTGVETITTGNLSMGNLSFWFYGSGSWTLQDNLTLSSGSGYLFEALRFLNGTFNAGSNTVTAVTNSSGWNPNAAIIVAPAVVNLDSSTWNLTGDGGSDGLQLASGTLDCDSATINTNGFTYTSGTFTTGTSTINDSGNFTGGGQTYNIVNLNGTSGTIAGSNNFTTLTFTGTATQTDSRTLTAGTTQTVSGTFTATGNSATNRLMVMSSAASTATINAAVTAITNTDFYYITGAGAGDWDISAVAGESVEFGSCVGITFTYAYDANGDMYWVGNSGDLSATTITEASLYHWSNTSGGVLGAPRLPPPTALNNVYFDANSFTLNSQTVTRRGVTVIRCKDMDWTGVLHNPTFSMPSSYNGTLEIYGNLTFATNMTVLGNTINGTVRFVNSLSSATIDMGGHTGSIYFLSFGSGAMNCDYTLLSDFTWSLGTTIELGNVSNGYAVSFDFNGFDFNIGSTSLSPGRSKLTFGSGIITMGNIGGASTTTPVTSIDLGSSTVNTTSWDMTNESVTGGTSTINCSGNFLGNGQTYYIVNITGASTISGNNTFTTLNITGATASITGSNTITNLTTPSGTTQTFTITGGTTQTITGTATLSGSTGKIHTFTSTNTWNIVKTSGTVIANYLSLSYSAASGGADFYAGADSTDVIGNSGWIFKSPPSVTTTSASPITSTTATLRGTLASVGGTNQYSTVYVYFEVADPAYWAAHSTDPNPYNPALETAEQTKYAAATITQLINGLTNTTTYHYRISVRYVEGTDRYAYGLDTTFTTGNYPDVVTGQPVNITTDSATLQGSLTYMAGLSTATCYFEYSTDSYYTTHPTAHYNNITTGHSLTATGDYWDVIGGITTPLIPNALYHFRAVVSYTGTSSPQYGADVTFTTSVDTLPNQVTVNWVYVFENCLESDDMLFWADFSVIYGAIPIEPISSRYILRLVDSSGVDIKDNVPYAYFNNGYAEGLCTIYFTADEVTTLGLSWASSSYTMRLDGNPSATWTNGVIPQASPIPSGSFTWIASASRGANQAIITSYIRAEAQVLQYQWNDANYVLLTSTSSSGLKLTTQGEAYFTNVLPDLSVLAPDVLATIRENLELVTTSTVSTPYSGTIGSDFTGSPLDLTDSAAALHVGGMWLGIILTLFICAFCSVAASREANSYKPFILLNIPLIYVFTRIGWFPMLLTVGLGIISAFCVYYVIFYEKQGA